LPIHSLYFILVYCSIYTLYSFYSTAYSLLTSALFHHLFIALFLNNLLVYLLLISSIYCLFIVYLLVLFSLLVFYCSISSLVSIPFTRSIQLCPFTVHSLSRHCSSVHSLAHSLLALPSSLPIHCLFLLISPIHLSILPIHCSYTPMHPPCTALFTALIHCLFTLPHHCSFWSIHAIACPLFLIVHCPIHTALIDCLFSTLHASFVLFIHCQCLIHSHALALSCSFTVCTHCLFTPLLIPSLHSLSMMPLSYPFTRSIYSPLTTIPSPIHCSLCLSTLPTFTCLYSCRPLFHSLP
jgi:hypothetical protein